MWENYIIINIIMTADHNIKHSEESFKVIEYLEMDNLRLRYNLVFVSEAESTIPSIYLLRNDLFIEAHLNSRPPRLSSEKCARRLAYTLPSFLQTLYLPGGKLVKYESHDSKRVNQIEYTLIAVRFWSLYVVGVCPLNA